MPLITKKPPKTVGTLAKAAVRDAFSPSTLGGRANASVTATPTLSEPHPVYNLGLDEVVKGDKANLKAARQTGWRYLVVHGTDVVAATEVHQSSARGVATFSNISEGSFAEGSGAAIAAAKDLPGLEAHDFELRLLRIPAL
ncbi:MAG: hypothetical protein NT069_11710, partial [Planctomycetota bacterium]|nr:hypothetical protein [Planctomycetota bacterium]